MPTVYEHSLDHDEANKFVDKMLRKLGLDLEFRINLRHGDTAYFSFVAPVSNETVLPPDFSETLMYIFAPEGKVKLLDLDLIEKYSLRARRTDFDYNNAVHFFLEGCTDQYAYNYATWLAKRILKMNGLNHLAYDDQW